ncbi:uncharacterized protein PpBr36_10593 [Pyricularia pennisetigena]|uniref:uncharacterized protein n=1 Tax=Pyricularia pennisetigena TaxID=1578925 RepID=UPI00114F9F02|nr:uncharacterized protein PpBr36_10593 [Pyricularia pennisetigena]TLS21157.1 hypothetical protein PpBr36_10593 [Pyricularia pennisetigena]
MGLVFVQQTDVKIDNHSHPTSRNLSNKTQQNMATQQPDDHSDGPWSEKNKRKFRNKDLSEFYDPCQEAAARSIQCLNRNGGDRTMCQDYFAAYRECKKQWIGRKKEVYSIPKESKSGGEQDQGQ